MYEVSANETTFHSYKYFNVILFFAVQEKFLGKMSWAFHPTTAVP